MSPHRAFLVVAVALTIAGAAPPGDGCPCTPPPPPERGRLDAEIVSRIVREHASQVRYCFDRENLRAPGVYGTVKVTWLIGTEGKVIQANVVDTTVHSANIEGCIVTRVKTWAFPRVLRGRPTRVTFPFTDRRACPTFATNPAACDASAALAPPPLPANPFTTPGIVRSALNGPRLRDDDDIAFDFEVDFDVADTGAAATAPSR